MKLKTALLGAAAALALAPAAFAERGTDGDVNVLYWQAVVDPEPLPVVGHQGRRSRLAGPRSRWPASTKRAKSSPVWPIEFPTVENGGISADLTSITWKLKPGLLWSDGTPVTSADAKFTWEYCTHPEGGCAQAARYEGIAVDRDAG